MRTFLDVRIAISPGALPAIMAILLWLEGVSSGDFINYSFSFIFNLLFSTIQRFSVFVPFNLLTFLGILIFIPFHPNK